MENSLQEGLDPFFNLVGPVYAEKQVLKWFQKETFVHQKRPMTSMYIEGSRFICIKWDLYIYLHDIETWNETYIYLHIEIRRCRDCCSVLQCVAVCCSVLQCVAVCCSVLHYLHIEIRRCRDVGGWGRDPRKQKDFCTTVKKRPKKNI